MDQAEGGSGVEPIIEAPFSIEQQAWIKGLLDKSSKAPSPLTSDTYKTNDERKDNQASTAPLTRQEIGAPLAEQNNRAVYPTKPGSVQAL
ncbi:hypothetical protein EMCRGX_G026334 [Ephydatia muelleri]